MNLIFRNGLRPSRFYVLKDNVMVMASEVGVFDTDPANVALKVNLKNQQQLFIYFFVLFSYYIEQNMHIFEIIN